jgi:hypothetical protein
MAAAGGVLLALAVGVSRLALQAHSVSEVASGLALGYCVSLPFIARREVPRGPVAMLLASAALATLLVLPLGSVAGATHVWVEDIATFLSGRERPFQRGEWSWRGFAPDCHDCRADTRLCAPPRCSG